MPTIVSLPKSHALEYPAADPKKAQAHLTAKLSMEVDPSDLYTDISAKVEGFVVVDARSPEAYARGHIPGAVSLWHRSIDKTTTAKLPKNKLFVTYCSGVGCNASTKGALKLASLGFQVKELIGGFEWWKFEGYPVETSK